jgi:putative aldouronate transport system permease protein
MQTTIPKELYESASIDGCSNFRFFRSIVVPISGAIIAILGLFYGIGHWNSYWSALLYIYDVGKYPLQLVLRDILLRNQISSEMLTAEIGEGNLIASMYEIAESVKYVVVVAACLPIIIIFPFLEKYFIKGVMIGSIKG